jgi:hypothetical protein
VCEPFRAVLWRDSGKFWQRHCGGTFQHDIESRKEPVEIQGLIVQRRPEAQERVKYQLVEQAVSGS